VATLSGDMIELISEQRRRSIGPFDVGRDLAPPLPPVMPDWSPVRSYGGYQRPTTSAHVARCSVHRHAHAPVAHAPVGAAHGSAFGGALGCFAF
jgi:hypothetical protein